MQSDSSSSATSCDALYDADLHGESPAVAVAFDDGYDAPPMSIDDAPSPTTALAKTAVFPPDEPMPRIVQLVAALGKVSIERIAQTLRWETTYESTYGDLRDYIISYAVLLVVSPLKDEVALRVMAGGARKSSAIRRPMKVVSSTARASWSSVSSVAYTSVGDGLNIDGLRDHYIRRGLGVEMLHGVLHVSFVNVFDVFYFADGTAVWWGANRADHWIVEDDLIRDHSTVSALIIDRHHNEDIHELYPVWSTFSITRDYTFDCKGDNSEFSEAFDDRTCFDYFLVPAVGAVEVMLAVSYGLSCAAKMDLYEHTTVSMAKEISTLPRMAKGIVDYVRNPHIQKRPMQLRGTLRTVQMMMQKLADEPNFLWELPRLNHIVEKTMEQHSVQLRRQWFQAKVSAQYEILDHVRSTTHHVFMVRSDVFLIGLLVADVLFMLVKLIITLFFVEPSKTNTIL